MLLQVLEARPFFVHSNLNEAGQRGKRHRLREAGLWKDPPAYFDTPNGFVQASFFSLQLHTLLFLLYNLERAVRIEPQLCADRPEVASSAVQRPVGR